MIGKHTDARQAERTRQDDAERNADDGKATGRATAVDHGPHQDHQPDAHEGDQREEKVVLERLRSVDEDRRPERITPTAITQGKSWRQSFDGR